MAPRETHESYVYEKQNVCEHRNVWLPGPARDLARRKLPHKDCRGPGWPKSCRALEDLKGLSSGPQRKALHRGRWAAEATEPLSCVTAHPGLWRLRVALTRDPDGTVAVPGESIPRRRWHEPLSSWCLGRDWNPSFVTSSCYFPLCHSCLPLLSNV